MVDSAQKARETRERNQAARSALWEEQTATTRAARLALQRVMEAQEATPAEILEAARLLVEIGKH